MNPQILKSFWEHRQEVIDRLQALGALTEGREPTAEETQAEQRMAADLKATDEKIAKGMDELEREQRSAEAFQRYERLTQGQAQPNLNGDNRVREQADGLRAFLRGEKRSFDASIDSNVLNAYDHEKRAWRNDGWESRALLESTGGMPLPRSFSGQLYEAYVAAATVLRAKSATDTLFITTSGENFDVPRALAHGAATTTAENVAIAGTDPTLTFVTLSSFKEDQLLQVSRELVEDEGFDIVGYSARAMGRNCGILADTHYVAGSGTGQAQGFLANVNVGVTGPAGTGTSLGNPATVGQGADLLVSLKYSILEQYRTNAYWMMNDATIAKVVSLKDTNGQPIFLPALAPGQPDTLLGRPILSNANMPVMANAARSIAFGDFNGYAVRIVRGVRFERSDDFAFSTDLVTFKAVLRTDGRVVDPNAIKVFINTT
jgi:HK97 family phage major capsid protein